MNLLPATIQHKQRVRLLVSRLNASSRRTANLEDVETVEPQMLMQGGYYFRHIYNDTPENARAVMDALAFGQNPPFNAPTRRWLEMRLLIDAQGHIKSQSIPCTITRCNAPGTVQSRNS